jgi:hypothetical protein
MKPNQIKRLYGPAATGEHFWPRPEITGPILDALLAGESVSLFGLRRTGKSSVLLEVERGLREAGRKPVYVDVQGRDRIDPIVSALISALPTTNVRRVFAEQIRPSLDEDFYDQFDTRVARYKEKDKAAARAVLRCVDGCVDEVAELSLVDSVLVSERPDARDDLLVSLVEDGFIRVDTRAGTVAFSSPLVRTWWQSKPYRR